MGGAMALHLVGRHHPELAGVFVLSSFLNQNSVALQVSSPHTSASPAPTPLKLEHVGVCVCVCFRL